MRQCTRRSGPFLAARARLCRVRATRNVPFCPLRCGRFEIVVHGCTERTSFFRAAECQSKHYKDILPSATHDVATQPHLHLSTSSAATMQLQGPLRPAGSRGALAITASAAPQQRQVECQKGANVIQLISDGFGPASETFARAYMQSAQHKAWNVTLPLDKLLVGEVRTRSTDSLVTDSAASATAYSCGLKSVNAYIGVDSDTRSRAGRVVEVPRPRATTRRSSRRRGSPRHPRLLLGAHR